MFNLKKILKTIPVQVKVNKLQKRYAYNRTLDLRRFMDDSPLPRTGFEDTVKMIR